MKLKYVPAFITLIAGAITCIISIMKQNDVLESLKILLLVLIIFYIIGVIARNIIAYTIKNHNEYNPYDDEASTEDISDDDSGEESEEEIEDEKLES